MLSYVSIRASMRQHTSASKASSYAGAYAGGEVLAYVSIRASIRQHTSAYVSK